MRLGGEASPSVSEGNAKPKWRRSRDSVLYSRSCASRFGEKECPPSFSTIPMQPGSSECKLGRCECEQLCNATATRLLRASYAWHSCLAPAQRRLPSWCCDAIFPRESSDRLDEPMGEQFHAQCAAVSIESLRCCEGLTCGRDPSEIEAWLAMR